jgi:hypothetical protein
MRDPEDRPSLSSADGSSSASNDALNQPRTHSMCVPPFSRLILSPGIPPITGSAWGKRVVLAPKLVKSTRLTNTATDTLAIQPGIAGRTRLRGAVVTKSAAPGDVLCLRARPRRWDQRNTQPDRECFAKVPQKLSPILTFVHSCRRHRRRLLYESRTSIRLSH